MATFYKTVSDSLDLFDTVVLNWVFAPPVSDALTLTDGFYANFEGIRDNLILSDSFIWTGPHYISLTDSISLFDNLITSGAQLSQQVSDQLTLTDLATKYGNQFSESVSDTLTLVDTGVRANYCVDQLTITDSFVWTKNSGVSDQLTLIDSLVISLVYSPINFSDSVLIVDGLSFYKIFAPTTVGCPITKTYSPSIYPNASGYTPPSSVEPTIVPRKTIILTFPYASPTITVELRNPLLNDLQKNTYKKIIRKTRGGNLILFRDPIWPKFKTLNYIIQMVSETAANEILNFFDQSLGLEVGLLDFESRQWRGYITTPSSNVDYEVARIRTVQFEFEGALA